MYLIGFIWIMLLSLSTICYGQKMPNSSVKKPDKMPKGTENSGKISTQFDILLEDLKGEKGQKIKKVIEGLSKKQHMVEAIFSKTTNEESEIYSKDGEYKCLKERCSEINLNDPPLSQLLEHLIAVQMNAKEGLEYESVNELKERIETLKGSLAYAVTFMAKRHKIQLNSERRGEEKFGKRTNDQRPWWNELANYYNEFEMDKIGIKCHKNSEYNGNKNGKEKENKGREERFFRFVTRTLEMKWEGNAFSNGQSSDDDDDDAIRSRKRRKRRMPNAPSPLGAYYNKSQSQNDGDGGLTAAIFMVVIFVLVVIWAMGGCEGIRRNIPFQNQTRNIQHRHNNAPRAMTNVAAMVIIMAPQTMPPQQIANSVAMNNDMPARGTGRSEIMPPRLMPQQIATSGGGELMYSTTTITPLPTVRSAAMPQRIRKKVLKNYREKASKNFVGPSDPDNTCAICLKQFDQEMKILPFPKCAHIFHDECLTGWLKGKHTTCPMCRLVLATGKIKMTQQQNGNDVGSSSGQMNDAQGDGAAHGVAVDDHHHEVDTTVRLGASNGTSNQDGAAHGVAVDDHQEVVIDVPSSDANNGPHGK